MRNSLRELLCLCMEKPGESERKQIPFFLDNGGIRAHYKAYKLYMFTVREARFLTEIPDGVTDAISEKNLKLVFKYLQEIKFGTITLIIQDNKVVQVEKLEKIRMT